MEVGVEVEAETEADGQAQVSLDVQVDVWIGIPAVGLCCLHIMVETNCHRLQR